MSCTPTKTGKSCCQHPEGSLNSYKAIVEAYIRHYQKPLADMLASFKRMAHRDAVKIHASHGLTADGKRHPAPAAIDQEDAQCSPQKTTEGGPDAVPGPKACIDDRAPARHRQRGRAADEI